MDPQIILLAISVAGASALQAATGTGFGVIAGPVMLMVLDSGSAIQISILLSFLIAAVLAPSLRDRIDRTLLARLLAGSVVGMPLGLWIFISIDITLLKLLAGVAVLFTLIFLLLANAKGANSPENNAHAVLKAAGARGANSSRPGRRAEQLCLGVISGVMSGSLAMPGPIPAAWMAARGYGKETVRATLLAMFILSYLAALALQASVAGIARETLWQCLLLAVPTLAGVYIGRKLAARLTERLFRRILLVVLAGTAIGLFSTSITNLVG